MPEEENNYTKMDIMNCLENIQSYSKNNDMQYMEQKMVDALKCSINTITCKNQINHIIIVIIIIITTIKGSVAV